MGREKNQLPLATNLASVGQSVNASLDLVCVQYVWL